MRHFTALLGIFLGLVIFGAPSVMANDVGVPNHPKLVDPQAHRLFQAGFLPEQTGMWEERVFPNDQGNHTALCFEDVTTQQVFPGTAPARGAGVFCLWDLEIVGANELFAPTASLSGCFQGDQSRQLVKFANCHVFFEDGYTTTGIPRHHVVSCPSENGGDSLNWSFSTVILAPGAAVEDETPSGFIEFQGEGTLKLLRPVCECDPNVCTPCCATCPDTN